MTNKQVELKNPRTGEIWICEDYSSRRSVDGKEFIEVHKPENKSRNHWIALDALVKVKVDKK